MKKIRVTDIIRMKEEGALIPVLTAYSYPIAAIEDNVGIPLILVGDSVGMVEAGYDSTVPVTVDEMIYHTKAVVRGVKKALVVADMPFLSYQTSTRDAIFNAGRLLKEGGAEAVKVEGGRKAVETIKALIDAEIPVMGHIGLTPQSVHKLGGYKVQGKADKEAEALKIDALAIEEAGVFSMVLEAIPSELAGEITASLKVPTIGIGAGPDCSGQVLVINDILGLSVEKDSKAPRFVKKYADLNSVVTEAVKSFSDDVSKKRFPDKEHSY